MRKEDKNQLIDSLTDALANNNNFYIADTSDLDSENTTKLRRLCHKYSIKVTVVKNTLLRKAMDKSEKNYEELYELLKGPTSILFAEAGNAPARMIKEFRKKSEKPILKGAFIEEMTYIGDDQLDFLVALKSKDELVGDIIALLQSPMRNVIGALQSGGNTISGLVKTLGERSE